MCRHSYSLSDKNSEKRFWIVTCFMYPRVFTKEGSCGGAQNILDLGPLKALIRLCMRKSGLCCHPVSVCVSCDLVYSIHMGEVFVKVLCRLDSGRHK